MKIKLLAIISILMFFSGCAKNNNQTDLQIENLKGKVKSVREKDYEAVEKFGKATKGETTRGFTPIRLTKYNEQGNMIEQNRYFSDGKEENKSHFQYNENGKKLKKEIYDVAKESMYRWNYEYDEQGKLIEINIYDSNGELIRKIIYRYDEKDRVIEEIGYNSEGNLEDRQTYEDNGLKNKTESHYNQNGVLVFRNDYVCDEKGNVITQEYNLYGFYGKDINTKITYEYKKYDEKGNWTEKIQYADDVLDQITEREIEYYD